MSDYLEAYSKTDLHDGSSSLESFKVAFDIQQSKINRLEAENEMLRDELVSGGIYGRNNEIEGCFCPKFYKKESPFSGIGYYCPLHGR